MRGKIVFFFLTLFLFSACTSAEEKNGNNSMDEVTSVTIWDYFYPRKDEPFIYAFQDKYNPISERFFRYITMPKDGREVFIIELYNETLRIFEGFTLEPNEHFTISDHMKVDKEGIKRSSKITKNAYFPKDFEDQAVFIADFPSHLDSIIMVYESRKNVIATDVEIDIMGEKLKTIQLIDSVRVHMVNRYTKETSTQEAPIYRFYAKGKGQVRFEGVNTQVQYNLQRILPDSWWAEYAN
jgi:hypothetical protein